MEKIKRIKPIELVKILEESVNCGSDFDQYEITKNNFILEEELWGLQQNGLYMPIGKLQLPVTSCDTGSCSCEKGYAVGLLTVFRKNFPFRKGDLDPNNIIYELFGPEKAAVDDESIILETLVVHCSSKEHSKYWETELGPQYNGMDPKITPYDAVMNLHIPRFLQLYDQIKGLAPTTELVQCIRNAFVDYRGGENLPH